MSETEQKDKWLCPICGSKLIMTTWFSGWDDEWVDPQTGEAMTLIRGERDSINEIRYRCGQECGWEGSEDDLREEEDDGSFL